MGKTDYSPEQKIVDEIFDVDSTFWSETYQANDVHGLNVRQRQAGALSYVDELLLPKNSRVLEIGCGAGFMSIALAHRGFAVEAVDHAPAMIELTQKHAKQTGTANLINASVEDVHELPFENASFDLIVSLGVPQWLHDLRKAMLEIVRVLKSGGYIVLSIPRSHAFFNPLSIPALELMLDKVSRKPVRPRRYLPKEFNQYLLSANLTIIKSKNVAFGPIKILGREPFSKIQLGLQQYCGTGNPILSAFGSQYIVLAQK